MSVKHVTFAGMMAFACTYRKEGTLYGITLYGTDMEQIEADWMHVGDFGIRVDGWQVELE